MNIGKEENEYWDERKRGREGERRGRKGSEEEYSIIYNNSICIII
jgi:hypothetical protein